MCSCGRVFKSLRKSLRNHSLLNANTMKKLNGGCLCGQVKFQVDEDFVRFYQCHCRQCQQLTGSAFASNLFTQPQNISWLKGAELISNYVDQERDFSKAFCRNCGSALPFVTRSAKALIVPAGSLDVSPKFALQANIFTAEKAAWYDESLHKNLPTFSGFPK